MVERLVDVLNSNGTVLHTYPVAIGAADELFEDTEYENKALEAAAHAQIVPDAELQDLRARVHVSRGGALAPFGDDQDTLSETKAGLDQIIRENAYALWEIEGRPSGRAEEHWHRARDRHLRERAYVLWQQEGCPDGQADDHWRRVCAFEAV
jgi:hypothetical protein